ncbi:hypothetical protein GCM10010317_065750 [Streptomyces mirabilis]|nr:hypothetical protein GCM10010317_065750 [Streptomyces mirabilis]
MSREFPVGAQVMPEMGTRTTFDAVRYAMGVGREASARAGHSPDVAPTRATRPCRRRAGSEVGLRQVEAFPAVAHRCERGDDGLSEDEEGIRVVCKPQAPAAWRLVRTAS